MNADYPDENALSRGGEPVRFRFILVAFVVYVPLSAAAFLWSVRPGTSGLQPVMAAALALTGVLAWTLLEYVLHWFVHAGQRAPMIGSAVGKLHMMHHRRPTYAAKITTPVWGSLPIAFGLLGVLRLVMGSWETALALMTGILGGYLFYELVHFRIHCGSSAGTVMGFQRSNHMIHHRSGACCFGVTTAVWDRVFGTEAGST